MKNEKPTFIEINVKDFNEAKESAEKLEHVLTMMISDLHEIKGMAQARIAYLYYRDLLWDIKYKLGLK